LITDNGITVDKRDLTEYSEKDMLEWPVWVAYQEEIAARKEETAPTQGSTQTPAQIPTQPTVAKETDGDTIYASAVVRSRFLKKSGGSVENEELLKLVDDVPEDLVLPDWVHDWAESTRITDPTFRPGELEHR